MSSRHHTHRLAPVKPRKLTGYLGARWRGVVPPLRPGFHIVVPQAVAGDAPKDFLRVYEFGTGRKAEPNTWPAYIAKVGHKWYPAESVTEQLITRIGQTLGFRMADSRLMAAAGQIRFLSRYFLRRNESLVHGAEIVAGYLEDEKFVQDVENQQLEREIFTFQVLCQSIQTRFPGDATGILAEFVRMLALDCLVGNQDRHLYNWGVVVHARGLARPTFSPIYDSARGLFWNTPESGLARFEVQARLERYVKEGNPLIGWDGESRTLNHFSILSRIASRDDKLSSILRCIKPSQYLNKIGEVLEVEFPELLSTARRRTILRCLDLRFRLFESAVAR